MIKLTSQHQLGGAGMTLDQIDKTGLIREAYNIVGISEAECRSIFLDWAIKLPAGVQVRDAITKLLAEYCDGNETHPMTMVLKAGLAAPERTGRRGGRAARVGS